MQLNPLGLVAGLVFGALACAMFLPVARANERRRRILRDGLRGQAVVVAVRPVGIGSRASVAAKPSDLVTVATAQLPRGVEPRQWVPAGQYHPGQIVDVVQDPQDPSALLLDRPELETSNPLLSSPRLILVMVPIVVLAAAFVPRS